METRKQSQYQPIPQFQGLGVHLIGIGGSGMRALARMLLERGAIVSGSDQASSSAVEKLGETGATIAIGQRGENIPCDCQLVVSSAAISDSNPEVLEARRRGVTVVKYARMLGMLMSEKIGLAVAGTHGKTTTSAMVSCVLREAGLDPSFIVGATVEQLGGPSGVGAGEHFVAEACEYDRSFLNLQPRYATILNIDEDHLDCYRDIDEIVEAFRAFAGRVPPEGVLVVNGDDRNAIESARSAVGEVERFGFGEGCTWRGEPADTRDGRVLMDVQYRGRAFCRITTPLPGMHSAYNTLAATALLYHAGLGPEAIAEHLEAFRGARRRMTLKASAGGVTVVDDFAHHPTEIQATLRGLREAYHARRLLCVFQPHQHSRTRFLLKDFAQSFALCDEVIVPDIYFVRDSEKEKDHISAADLVDQIRLRGGKARYCASFEEITEYLRGIATTGDLVVTMGAGNVWEIADELVRWLGIDR